MPTKRQYLDFINRAYQREQGRLPEQIARGLQQAGESVPLFGYYPPRWMLDFAAMCAFLYARTGDSHLVEQAKQGLFFYREWVSRLPPDAPSQHPEYAAGIPPMEPVFYPVIFVPAVQNIRAALTSLELEALVGILADSLRPIWLFPEWGGHNRALLRAAGLAQAAAAFPEHAEASKWASLADELAEESWGRWSIEDAMLYQAHWLRAMIRYAEGRGRLAELTEQIQPRLHLKAMTQLISPLGILPDFGDSHWLMHSQWEWMALLEWGAAAYRDPVMKWTASQIYQARQADQPDAYLATVTMLGWKWCDENLAESAPDGLHPPEDALDDLVIKKLVWRTGWDSQASYACLNYRDEGDYGRVARDYLRATLAVSAEKMHHGHADEGSLSMLTHAGALLLHESGYRESPPDGIYRSAVYHNRLVWRSGKQPEGLGLLEFLRGDGHYQPVRTERLYQTRLGDAVFSRVRVSDEVEGLAWDRSIIFLPDLPCWVVLDAVRAIRPGRRTISALWWSTDLLSQGEDWFETHLGGVGDWVNPKTAALLVCLPQTPVQPGRLSTQSFRRHFQPEVALARTWYGESRAGSYVNFVSLLWPHPYDDLDEGRPAAVEVIESQPLGRGIGVWLRWQGEERLLAALNDLNIACGQEDIRPTYTAARGMTRYAQLESDAAFVYFRKSAGGEWAGFINGTYLSVDERILYQGAAHAMFQEDATARPGVPRRFRWEMGS